MVKAPDSKSGGHLPAGVRIPLLSYMIHFISLCNNINAWMAEWSKAVDLSSILFVGVGSNPTSGIKKIFFPQCDVPHKYLLNS